MLALGIDLGTTNTVVATSAQALPLLEGDHEALHLPSAVAFLPGGGALVGHAASARRPIDPINTLYSAKRLMGESWTSHAARTFSQHYPHSLAAGPLGDVQFVTRAGAISPGQVASLLVTHACARAQLDPRTLRAVVAVPSSFRARARLATTEALKHVGIPDVRLIEEPVATAVAYLHRASLRYAAVYDLGGGTFDFAVVDCSSSPFRVLGHGGDPYLGGDDVDHALAKLVAERVLRHSGWDLRSDPVTFAKLAFEIEKAKRELSRTTEVALSITDVDPAAPPSLAPLVIGRDMLASAVRPFVQRTFVICDEVLGQIGLRARDIQAVFLAGGSTRLPLLPNLLADYFRRKVRSDLHPEHVVAVGASIAAARPELWPLLGARGEDCTL